MAPKKTRATKAVSGKPRRPGRLGPGHVNAHRERTKTFVNRQVRGVSTRHLPLYLGWLRALRRPGFSPEPQKGHARRLIQRLFVRTNSFPCVFRNVLLLERFVTGGPS